MAAPTDPAVDLDHVALASADAQPHLDVLVGALGGAVRGGGASLGFRAMQVMLGDMAIELIEPYQVDSNDFMARFLARHGAGPHHLTFKVPDLAAEIERLRALGYSPAQIDLANPFWKECFLTPDVAHGTVVQIAQSGEGDPEVLAVLGDEPPPWGTQWWRDPPPAAPARARLLHVAFGSPHPAATEAFFTDVLGGTADPGGVTWPGGGRIVVEPREGRPGIDRLVIDGPADVVVAGTRLAAAA